MGVLIEFGLLVLIAYLTFCYFRGKRRIRKREQAKQSTSIVIPRGDVHRQVYVYDGKPLKGLKAGDRIQARVLPGEMSMKSIYTNTEWHGDCCLTYKGRQIGFIGTNGPQHNLVAKLAREYGKVTVNLKVNSYDKALGFPRLVAELPSEDWFSDKL